MTSSENPIRPPHDMGGQPAGKVTPDEHDYALWERRVDAMMMLLSHPSRGLLRVDELRRGIESLPPEAYSSMTYYERWSASISLIMIEKGVIDADELEAYEAALKASGKAPA